MKKTFTLLLSLLALTSFAQVNLTQNLEAYYPFNGNAFDESTNSNDGIVSGATLTLDRFGNTNSAYSFTANDRIVSDYQLIASGDYSVSLWVKSTRASEGGNYFYCGNPDTDGITLLEQGTLVCNASGGNIGNIEMTYYNQTCAAFSNTRKLTQNEWTHLCVVNSGTSLKLYINGVLEASATEPTVGSLSAVTSIGKPDPDYPAPSVVGAIDDIRFYSRAINEQEVTALYADMSTSSVGTVNMAAQVNVYPNPSNGVFTIELPKQGANLTLVNAQGIMVKQYANFNQTKLQVADLPKGMYILQTELEGSIAYKKIVIQ